MQRLGSLGLSLVLVGVLGGVAVAGGPKPKVLLETNMGRIVVQLEPSRTPKTVENFLRYVREGFYDGTIFHRVVRGFVIQGGGYTRRFEAKPTHPPIPNEARTGLRNKRGTIAMARTMDPDSATSQFFINLKDNPQLDYRDETPQGAGYAAFGRVVEGMEVVDRIAQVPTGVVRGMRDVPLQPVVILKARLLSE